MEYLITAGDQSNINFAPESEPEEILQNVRCIMATTKFSVPLDRDFGIDADMVDMPIDYAKAQLASEIVTAIAKYEPRAAVTDISFDANTAGILIPKVKVRINET